MINAITLLRQEAQTRRGMTIPNANTVTAHSAIENAKLADEYDLAADMIEMYSRLQGRVAATGSLQKWIEERELKS